MKLWLQVLFVQGYLWRDRFPQRQPEEVLMHVGRPSVLMFLVGLVFSIAALTYLIAGASNYLEAIRGSLILALGSGYVGENIGFRVQTLRGSKAFWVSFSWASGFVVRVAVGALIVVSIVDMDWINFALWGVLTLPHTPGVNAIERRYLFFADPIRNGQMLNEGWRGALNLLADTYWRFPRQILFGIEPPPAVEGTRATEGEKDA